MPWVGALVHCVQVEGGLQLRLTSRQEHDSWDRWWHTATQHFQGVRSDLFWSGSLLVLSSWGNHGRLQQDAFKHDTIVSHVLESLSPGGGSDLQGAIDGVVTIEEDLWLDNWDEAGVLGYGGVAGQSIGTVTDGDLGWAGWDGDDGAPLAEASTLLVVVGATLGEAVETGAPRFAVGIVEWMESLVDLDTWDDALLVQAVDHWLASTGLLVEGLLEEDGTRDVLAEAWGGDEELTVGLTVGFSVLQADGFQALAASGVGFVHGEDTLALGGNLVL